MEAARHGAPHRARRHQPGGGAAGLRGAAGGRGARPVCRTHRRRDFLLNALEVADLTVRLGGTEIIRGVTFDLPRASCLAVIGPNGAGKTILLRALIGALPHAGKVAWAAGTVLGYVPQRIDIE